MKRTIGVLLKLGVTLGIFAAIFMEFGGGYGAVSTARLSEPGAFDASNPAYPGIVGQLRARLRGAPLPAPRLQASLTEVCALASERAVFVHLADGTVRRFKPL